MFKKKECYLCGGRLVNGRCSLCGLDNTKLEKKNYRLNESSFDRKKKMTYSQIRQNETGETKNKEQQVSAGHLCESHNGKRFFHQPQRDLQKEQMERTQKEKKRSEKQKDQQAAKKICTIGLAIVFFIIIAASLADSASETASSFSNGITSSGFPWGSSEESSEEVEYDPYADTERELSEVGETYECQLGYGEYEIGVQIPEGTYEVELVSGYGSIHQDDPENSIYYYSYLSNDETEDTGNYLDDVRLYTGGHLVVDEGLVVKLHSENAQTGQMIQEDNPLTEQVTLKAGNSYTAGKDFPAGFYDVTIAPGNEWAELQYKIYLGDFYEKEYDELNYQDYGLWFSNTDGDSVYRNAVLTDGTQVGVEEGDLILTPSSSIKNQEYDTFYDLYRYRLE